MRAVNLIPEDERRGNRNTGGRSGGAAYILLGALAGLVILAALYGMAGKQTRERDAQATVLEAEAQDAKGRATELEPYRVFARTATERMTEVTALAGGRFDWAHGLREVSRVVPRDVWLTSLSGTVRPGVQLEGAGAGGTGLRDGVNAPAFELTGCTPTQAKVALFMARLRAVDGVQRVKLATSDKSGDGAGSSGDGDGATETSDSGDGETSPPCSQGAGKMPRFALVVFFNPQASASAPVTATATASATAPATGAAATSTGGGG